MDTGDNRQYIQVESIQTTATQPTVTEPTATQPTATQPRATQPTATKTNTKPRLLINDDYFWDRNKIKLLLTLCLDRRFKCPDTDKILFNEISILIGTTPEECDKKYRSLRRTYVRLIKNKRLGKDIKWIHFGTCDSVFKHCKTLSPSLLEPWEDSKIRQLLSLYIENINHFRNSESLQKDIWKDIASQLDTTEYNCYHKFKNLKRTYFKWVERTRETGKLIKWPYHHYFERIYYNYRPNLKVWDKNKIRSLLKAYSEIAHKFRNSKYQKKELWKEISLKLNENPNHCDRKFRNLKQTYRRLKNRSDSGRSMIKWRYYKDFVALFENGSYIVDDRKDKPLRQDYVEQLLTFCIKHKEKFRDPLGRKRMLWKQISPKLGLTPEECDKKFRNLKQTYIRLAAKKRNTGINTGWPYFSYFEQIYDNKTPKRDGLNKCNIENLTMPEIRELVSNLQSKDTDNFEKLVSVIEDSNSIQRERNRILLALLNKK